MSYDINGGAGYLTAQLVTSINYPFTLGCFFKYTSHDTVTNCFAVYLSDQVAANDNACCLRTPTTDEAFDARASSDAFTIEDGATYTGASAFADGAWTGWLGIFTSATSRRVYVMDTAKTATNSTNIALANNVSYITIGQVPSGGNNWNGKVGQVAIWKSALDSTNAGYYLTGKRASGIDPSNLSAYWSMESGLTKTAGVDSVGDLTNHSATLASSDNPTITDWVGNKMIGLFGGKLRGKI